MTPAEFIAAAIAHGERVGLEGLSGLERAEGLREAPRSSGPTSS